MLAEPRCRTYPDGTVTVWVDGHPWVLTDSVQQRQKTYGGWATRWRTRAAGLRLSGHTAAAREWVDLADTAETMVMRLEEKR